MPLVIPSDKGDTGTCAAGSGGSPLASPQPRSAIAATAGTVSLRHGGSWQPEMPRSPEKMPPAELQTSGIDWPQEDARLAALAATEILDTEPEPSFDAITRLAAEYFQADTVLLGFADASRVWIKSYWGEAVRELPRRQLHLRDGACRGWAGGCSGHLTSIRISRAAA